MENSETKMRVRRMIQTTLFSYKSPENVVCVDDDIEIIDLEREEGDDECVTVGGSQSQIAKSKKRKPEAVSAQRASKKVAANGNETRGKDIEEISPSASKVDSFAKVSEIRQRQRQEKEPLSTESPENIERSCSPSEIIAFVLLRMAAFAQSHGGDGGGDPSRPPGSQGSERKNTRGPTTNIELKKAVERRGPLLIEFEFKDQKTYRHVGENAAWFGNLLGEIAREFPCYYPSWRDIPQEDKVNVYKKIRMHFDIDSHFVGPHGNKIKKGIEDFLCRRYSDNKHTHKVEHWVEKGGIAAAEEIRSHPPENVSAERWRKQVDFWMDPKRAHIAEVNARNRRNQIASFHGSRSLAVSRHEYFSIHQVYPSLIKNYFDNHTRNDVFVDPQAERNYNEMLRLHAQGEGTSTGIAMTDAEIVSQVLGGKQRGHLPGRGRKVSGVDSSSCFGSQSQVPRSYSQQSGVNSSSCFGPQSQVPRSYSQQEVDELLRQQAERQHNETMEARRAAERTQTQLNQIVAFLSSQPGLSSLSTMFPPLSVNDGNSDDNNGDGA